MRAVWRHGQSLVDDPARLEGVTALGMDETAFRRANRHHHTTYVSGLVDTATGRLLDVVQDRTATAVMGWLSRRDRRWLARIGVVALDPHRGYAIAVGVHLGHATLVGDHFHIIKPGNAVIDDVRRRVHNTTTGHRGRKRDPLYQSASCCSRRAGTSTSVGGSAWPTGCASATPTVRSSPRGSSRESPATCTAPATATAPATSSRCSTRGPTAATLPRCAASPALCAAGNTRS